MVRSFDSFLVLVPLYAQMRNSQSAEGKTLKCLLQSPYCQKRPPFWGQDVHRRLI